MKPWRDPALSLGARCLLLAEAERRAGVRAAPAPQPNTSLRVREYLAGCVRDLNGDGIIAPTEKLGLSEGNWCAAFQSWLLDQCLLPGEDAPHLYRAAVVEIELDARLRGLWHDADEVRAGRWSPNLGDLVIWDRSGADPATAWHRHVNRLVRWVSPDWEQFETIGGNESRAIQLQRYRGGNLSDPKLLGFVSYHQPARACDLSRETRDRMLRLVAVAIEEISKNGQR